MDKMNYSEISVQQKEKKKKKKKNQMILRHNRLLAKAKHFSTSCRELEDLYHSHV